MGKRHRRTILVVVGRRLGFFLVLIILVSCTSSPKPEPTATRAFARYFFAAPADRGVLEVTTGAASISYETQSYPASSMGVPRNTIR